MAARLYLDGPMRPVPLFPRLLWRRDKMIWTTLSLGIILIWVLGMILAAKLGNKSWHGAEPLGNCRRGAIKPSWQIKARSGATLIPKGPR